MTDTVEASALAEVQERESIKAWHRFYARFIESTFRAKRMALFSERFPVDETTRILDLGGAERTWTRIAEKPQVTMVNTWGNSYRNGRFSYVIADACALGMPNDSYDLAFSNSVIEHVGDFARQKAFADEVRRIAPQYFVQTPYRYFPIEPHFMCVGIQFLPKPLFKKLVRWLSFWGLTVKPSREEIEASVDEIRLLTVREMRELFPDAEIVRERFLLFTKSLIAIRRTPPA